MGILSGVTKTAERISRNAQHVVQGTANAVSKGAGSVIGGTLGLNKHMLHSSGSIIKEAMSEFRAGAKTAYGVTSGNTAKAAKESAEAAAKATKEATEKVGMQTRRLNQAQNALDSNFVGPHASGVVDDARKLNTLNNAKNPNFIGPMQSEAELRSINREVQATVSPDFIGPMTISQEMAESGAGFWSGLGEMVQKHPYIAAGIAGGVGVAGGALLFGDDDE